VFNNIGVKSKPLFVSTPDMFVSWVKSPKKKHTRYMLETYSF